MYKAVMYEEPDLTTEEARILSKAETEIYLTGKTDIVCPRCGKTLVTDELPHPIHCEDPDCIKAVVRGL